MRYHYVALSQDSRELGGVIEARDETEARAKLNALSMSVISLNEIAENTELVAQKNEGGTASVETPVFEFEAFDKNNKKVKGTIAASDSTKAFSRLFEEYKLSVYYLALTTLDAQSKKQQREKGITDIQSKYEEEKKAAQALQSTTVRNQEDTANKAAQSSNNQPQPVAPNPEAVKEKEALLHTVNNTIAKINEFLAQYGQQIKQEERDIITGYTNQLLRIKDSSNLDHIRATCEKMLQHIQRQELFVNEQEKVKESAKLKLETNRLLDELNVSNLSKSIYINDIVETIKSNPLTSFLGKLLTRIIIPLTPEMRAKKNEISTLEMHLKTYYKTLFFGSTKNLKNEAWEAIKTLRAQRKRIELELQVLKDEQTRIAQAERIQSADITSAWGTLSGFLLSFYLIAYMGTYFFSIKQTTLNLSASFFFYSTTWVKGVTVLFFIYYAIGAFFRLYERYNTATFKTVLYCLGFVGYLLLAVNLF